MILSGGLEDFDLTTNKMAAAMILEAEWKLYLLNDQDEILAQSVIELQKVPNQWAWHAIPKGRLAVHGLGQGIGMSPLYYDAVTFEVTKTGNCAWMLLASKGGFRILMKVGEEVRFATTALVEGSRVTIDPLNFNIEGGRDGD